MIVMVMAYQNQVRGGKLSVVSLGADRIDMHGLAAKCRHQCRMPQKSDHQVALRRFYGICLHFLLLQTVNVPYPPPGRASASR